MANLKIIADKQVPMSPMIRLMCGDARTQVVSVVIPRMFGDVDLCDLAWSIKVVNSKGVADVCTPYGEVKCTDDEIVVDWLICGVATAAPGTTVFEVVGVDETVDGHPIVWKSGIGNLLVNECLNASPSGEQEEQLSSLDKLIIYVNGELTNVIAAGDAANDAAEKANQASESIAALEGEIEAAENARVEKFAGYEKRIDEAEKLAQESVLYTEQTLTEAQQAQARENVGAASAERLEAVEDALPGKLTEPAEGLAVGKYFRVAALDENGHAVLEAVDAPKEGLALTPTGWPEWTADEQAAARERMGIPGEYVLIADVTLEEDISGIKFSKEPDETPFNLKKFIVMISEFPEGSWNSSYLRIDAWTKESANLVLKYLKESTMENKYVFFAYEAISPNLYRVDAGVQPINSNIFLKGNSDISSRNYGASLINDTNIIKINVYRSIGTDTLPAGTNIKLYGVRA